jgi:predicted RNase H-like nuclease
MSGMRFAGVDLAWSAGNPSGVALLTYSGTTAEIAQWALLRPLADLEMWLLDRCRYFGIIAVDAPLIYPDDAPSFRPCDKAVATAFRKAAISPLPLTRESAARALSLVQTLSDFGYDAEPAVDHRALTRGLIEVFPTPALLALSGEKIRYKRGTLKERASGLSQYQEALFHIFQTHTPRLQTDPAFLSLVTADTAVKTGPSAGNKTPRALPPSARIARLESILDAVFCAYIALYYWYWGEEKCKVYGDTTDGFIIIPTP